MHFDFYLPCADGTNGIGGPEMARGVAVSQENGTLLLRRLDGTALGAIEVFDVQGRSLLRTSSFASSIVLRTDELAGGIVIIRTTDAVLRTAIVTH